MDLFREGIRRDESAAASNYAAWFSLAKAYRRCGRLTESLGAARKAVEIWKEKGGGDRSMGELGTGMMEEAIKEWEGGGEFDKELGRGVAHWIDVYLTDEDGKVEGAIEGEGGGLGKTRPRIRELGESWGGSARTLGGAEEEEKVKLWGRVRRGIVSMALKEDTESLLELTRDRTHTMHEREIAGKLARVGLLCAAHRHVSVGLARCGARFIGDAIEQGVFEKGEEGVAVSSGRRALMWRRLAECNVVVALGEGYGREMNRWLDAKNAWKQALSHIECATDMHCWESYVHVLVTCGECAEAATTLGILLRSFKPRAVVLGSVHSAGEGRGGSYNTLFAASLLLKLGNYEQAHTYIVKILEKAIEQKREGGLMDGEGVDHVAPPAPLTYLHLTFMASRCYEEWGRGGGGEGPKKVALSGYRRVYSLMLDEHDGLAEKNELSMTHGVLRVEEENKVPVMEQRRSFKLKKKFESVDHWLGSFELWRGMAVDFHSAGLDLFAGDLMNQAARKLPRRHGHTEGAGGTKRKELAEHFGEAPLEFWIEAAQIYWRGGDESECVRMLEVGVEKFPDSRRAAKMLRQVQRAEVDKSLNLRHMKKMHVDKVCGMVLQNLKGGKEGGE